MNWYVIENIEEIDSPSVVLYEDRLMYNLDKMVAMVGDDCSRLMPHIKTNKMPEVIKRMLSLKINNFKASTIAEAEMAAQAGASSVLIAHQLVGPKIERFIALVLKFPKTKFSTIVDNITSAEKLNLSGSNKNLLVNVFIDINNGMNRSGVKIGTNIDELIIQIERFNNLFFNGLHVYDGHLRDSEYSVRKKKVENDFTYVNKLFKKLKKRHKKLQLICGGTPTFTAHLDEGDRICSPGTCLFWDWGYDKKLTEQEFKIAALLVTRVISKPIQGIVTIDLGHKAVASENPINHRVKFLNMSDYKLLSQSEEHGVLQIKNWDSINVGDVLYGVPYHICPTINLYDEVSVIENGKKTKSWEITARKRKISI